jgi:hepatocyte nuclear factor 4
MPIFSKNGMPIFSKNNNFIFRIALVKSCFGPLTLFKCSARTAVVTENEDMLCLCNFAYVPRNISKAYNDA